MSYTIEAGQTKPVLDETGAPLATAGVTSDGGALPPYGVGLAATIEDDGTGHLVCVGNAPNATGVTFDLIKDGTTASHVVVVTAAPFDWTLG